MTLRLETPRRIGTRTVAAIVETRIRARRTGGGISASGSLAPRAILVAEDGTVSAFAPDGRPMPLDSVAALLPDAIARLLAA